MVRAGLFEVDTYRSSLAYLRTRLQRPIRAVQRHLLREHVPTMCTNVVPTDTVELCTPLGHREYENKLGRPNRRRQATKTLREIWDRVGHRLPVGTGTSMSYEIIHGNYSVATP